MGQIRRQTIISSLIIYSGFLLGAFNLLYVLPKLLPVEYIGLTRLIQDFAAIMTAFAGLGFAGPFYRFGPYYEKYSKPSGNDLLQLFLILTHVGVVIVFSICYLFRADIITNFEAKSPLFSTYFYATFLFAYLFIIYNLLELYLFSKGQAILQSFTREILVRIIILLLTLSALYYFTLHQFVWLYAGHYLIPVVILLLAVYRRYPSPIGISISRTTKRLSPFISKMASWGIVQTIVSTGVPVLDTLVIGGIIGLKGVAEYQIMSYVSTMIHVPLRATISILGARLSSYWMDNDLNGIKVLFQRTSMSYLAFALFAVGLIMTNIDLLQLITGKNISISRTVIGILLCCKVVELSTGLSNMVIGYSKKWRYENILSIINIIIAIPLNIILVRSMGLMGAALSSLILVVAAFSARLMIIYFSFGLFPYTLNTLKLLGGFMILFGVLTFFSSIYPSIFARLFFSLCYTILFLIFVLKMRFSEDLNIAFETGSKMIARRMGV